MGKGLIVAVLALSACEVPTVGVPPTSTLAPPPTDTAPPPTATDTSVPPTATETPVPPTDTPAPTDTPDVLPADPVRITFKAADGTDLVGYYYPAAVENAPLVVLMHMAGDNQQRWVSVGLVPWLQNRGLPGTAEGFDALYPAMPVGRSYAVFTFDFRSHGESAAAPITDLSQLLDDARAGVDTARSQPGVDPNRVGLAGSSIGADAAVDVCGDGCLAALSFSPGSYLGQVYSDTVQMLDQRGIPAWCLAATGDREADPTCASAAGTHYRSVSFEGNDHGTNLIQPGQVPEIGPILLEWLETWNG